MLFLSRSRGLTTPQPCSFERSLERESPSSTSSPNSPSQPAHSKPTLSFSPRRATPVSCEKTSREDWVGLHIGGDYRSRLDSSLDTTSQEENSSEYTSQEEEEDEEEQEQEVEEAEDDAETDDEENDEKEEAGEEEGEWPFILSPEEAMASRQLVEAQRHYKQLLQASVDLQLEKLHVERSHEINHVSPPEDARVRAEELELATLLASLQFRTKHENSLLQQQHADSVARGLRSKAQTCAANAQQTAAKAKAHADTAASAIARCLAAVERIEAKQRAEAKQEVKQPPPQLPQPPSLAGDQNEEKKEANVEQASDALQIAESILKRVKAAKFSENGIDPRKINVAVNQISVQIDQVMKKVAQLKQILGSAPNPEALNFGLRTLATAICNQNITQVKAFSYAIVIFFVTLDFPFLNDVFLATLYEACGFCIPNYLNRANYKTLNDYKLALGFLEVQAEGNQPKGFEEEEKYFERMDGYVALYAAYTQITHQNHPHGIAHAWKWCANLLNTKPVFATASVLGAFLRVAGYQLQQKYPRQFKKMMQFIADDFIARLPEKNPAQFAAKRRLQLFVEHNYFKNNCQLDMPEGREMPRVQASDLSRPQVEQGDDLRF